MIIEGGKTYLNAHEAMAYLGYSIHSLYQYIKPAKKMRDERGWQKSLYLLDDLDAHLTGLKKHGRYKSGIGAGESHRVRVPMSSRVHESVAGDSPAVEDEVIAAVDYKAIIDSLLEVLTPREEKIMRMLYGVSDVDRLDNAGDWSGIAAFLDRLEKVVLRGKSIMAPIDPSFSRSKGHCSVILIDDADDFIRSKE